MSKKNECSLTGKDYEKIMVNDSSDKDLSDEALNILKPLAALEITDIINKRPNFRKDKEKLYLINLDGEPRFNGIVGTYHDPNFSADDGEKYDLTVKICSRFDSDQKPDKNFFMAEMMRCYIETFCDIKLADGEIPCGFEDLFEILKICIFRKKLFSAYQAGFYKKYTYFQNNDSRLRGRIDVARHIKENMGMSNGKIAYEYRENTEDNGINHLILRTWMELKNQYGELADIILSKETGGKSAEQILRDLQYRAPGYQKRSIQQVIREARIPVTALYYEEYEELRKWCLEILNGLNLSLYVGKEDSETEVESMLFYVPDLWEIYVGSMLKEKVPSVDIEEQKEIKVLSEDDDWYSGVNYPDFLIKDENGKNILVLDAKFKPVWSKWRELHDNDNIKTDIRQVLSYGTLTGARYMGVIFPIDIGKKEKETHVEVLNIGERDDVKFLICGLKIPEIKPDMEYKAWRDELEKEKEKLCSKLTKELTEGDHNDTGK